MQPFEIKPTGGYPAWASGTSGAAVITQPDANTLALGWQVAQAPPSSFVNWLDSQTFKWTKYLNETRAQAHLGDASDGDLVLGATTYQLTRHMFVGDLSVGPSSILDLNGYALLALGVFSGQSGIIRSRGGNASGAVGGGAGAGPFAGATGSLQGGANSAGSVINSLGGAGGNGGTGGIGVSVPFGGTSVQPSGIWRGGARALRGYTEWSPTPTGPTMAALRGGAGGAAGAGINAGASSYGGGGGGGGLGILGARDVNWNGQIDVSGGAGGTTGSSGGGSTGMITGGGGGGGGAFVLAYGALTSFTALMNYAGGAAGSGTSGCAGQTGASGLGLFLFQL